MHIILGGTGHVGTAAASALLDRGEAVTVVSRNRSRASTLAARGARVAIADVNDVDGLRGIIGQGTRLLLLNPPADPSTDVDTQERKTVAAILAALAGADLERIVAVSTYGAQANDHLADLGSLYEMEQALAGLPVPATIIRGAYYMSNWKAQLANARDGGVIHTFFPARFKLPMVDPADIGKQAAALMVEPAQLTGILHVEGPERYSANDVANAFASALHRPVRAIEVPQERWIPTLRDIGFSREAAISFANSFAATLQEPFPGSADATQCATTLERFIATLAKASRGDGRDQTQ